MTSETLHVHLPCDNDITKFDYEQLREQSHANGGKYDNFTTK